MDSAGDCANKALDSLKNELNMVKPLVKQTALNADAIKYKIQKVKVSSTHQF